LTGAIWAAASRFKVDTGVRSGEHSEWALIEENSANWCDGEQITDAAGKGLLNSFPHRVLGRLN
jgi:hypothetical protein